jgi:hypothetical protein
VRFDVARSRARRLVWAGALVLLALVALLAAFAFRGGEEGPPRTVPPGATPAQDFRNLADWLRERGES